MNNARAYAIAALLGALLTLTFAPLYWAPLLFVSFSGLLWLLDMVRNTRCAFWLGYWFGMGHFATSLYWIANSLLIDVAQHGWLIPFAVMGIPALLSAYTGAATALLYRLNPQGVWRIVLFAAIWVVAELLRAHLLTGFPWNAVGYSLMVSDALMQTAHIWGVYGLSLLAVCFALVPYLWLKTVPRRKSVTVVACALLVSLYAYGTWRLDQPQAVDSTLNVRIVQPHIEKQAVTSYDDRIDQVWKHMELTASPAGTTPDVVIWPEAAISLLLEEQPELRRDIAKLLPKDSMLLAGGIRVRIEQERVVQLWNSVFALNTLGAITAVYDKQHLVPFGEYVPLRALLPFMKKITEGMIDITPGMGARVLEVAGITMTPLVCYEAIFSGHVAPSQLLLNVTDDAWFGETIGPHQHAAMSRLRAVEQGVPLVRAANTGISFAVDPYGRVISQLALGEQGVLDVKLPIASAEHSHMLYQRAGLFVPVAMLLLIVGAYSVSRMRWAASRSD